MKDFAPNLPQTAPRTVGVLELGVGSKGRIDTLYQQGASKVLFGRKPHGTEAIFINTSGGLTGGDTITGRFQAHANADLTVTTQGCERVYRSIDAALAVVRNTVHVSDDARFNWLPQETIFYDGGSLDRSLDIAVTFDAHTLIVEPMLFGRLAMGETQLFGSLRDRISLRLDDRLVFQDVTNFQNDISEILNRPAVMAGARATALVLYSSRMANAVLPKIRTYLNETSGASVVQDHVLVARLIAQTGYDLRKILGPIITEITNAAPPKTWRL